jgi:RND family efflux transporter MFP subunit
MKLTINVILFTVLIFALSCTKEEKQEKTEKFKVTNPIVKDTTYLQEYVADIQASQNIEIRSRIHGFIEKQWVDEGQFVKEGQVLFSLSNKVFLQDLQKAKINKKTAQTEVKSLEIELQNTEKLYANNIVAKPEVDLLKVKIEVAKTKVEMAESEESQAQLNLSFTDIKAPFSGIINRIPFKKGSLVEEGSVLTSLSNNNLMYIYFNLSEIDYLNYVNSKEKQEKVTLLLADNKPYPYQGKIETMEGEFDKSTGNIAFRASFLNPNQILKHGSSGKILIEKNLNGTLLIPQKSTYEIQGNYYVYLVNNDNQLKSKKVNIGLRFNNLFQITSGLSASDKILFEGIQLVKDGDKITFEEIPSNQIITQISE